MLIAGDAHFSDHSLRVDGVECMQLLKSNLSQCFIDAPKLLTIPRLLCEAAFVLVLTDPCPSART